MSQEIFPQSKRLYRRLYKAGPRPSHSWGGVCEVDDTETKYIHHMGWPNRATYVSAFNAPLSNLIAAGQWELVLDPSMEVDEGL